MQAFGVYEWFSANEADRMGKFLEDIPTKPCIDK